MLASEFAVKALNSPINGLKRGVKAVLEESDPEAIHDMRVAIRRIRSILREMGGVFDRYYVNKIRADLRTLFNQTGELRDTEVAVSILLTVEVSDSHQEEYREWLKIFKDKEIALKNTIQEYLKAHPIDGVIKTLRAVLSLPIKENKDSPVEIYGFKKINKIRTRIIEFTALTKNKMKEDPARYHQLRIFFKRLRYNIEFFSQALPATYKNIVKFAKKNQTLLGDLHDMDVLLIKIREDEKLNPALKSELEMELSSRKEKLIFDFLKHVDNLENKI